MLKGRLAGMRNGATMRLRGISGGEGLSTGGSSSIMQDVVVRLSDDRPPQLQVQPAAMAAPSDLSISLPMSRCVRLLRWPRGGPDATMGLSRDVGAIERAKTAKAHR